MKIIMDEKAQGSAELILLFGGIIVIAIVAVVYYKNYVKGLGNEINSNDVKNLTKAINGLKNKF
ncbi:MAG: class III signal peptide-containing protein [Methanobacteriaceae archaeon]|nr:class III signal peptide-containing protein [Methanobacteriaceae archaeon]MDP2837112.1 class III signal peptide-containing protein [Methanobacteriaceae archaeon]MDP3035231.1 class III signal peptide-containing protein [Methanobacteriaceae archaeon]MDP3485663.1 class III signal peptide-containing protein [Methanobacteriaceae archaeon]MDP3624069.1 class III signal peptide-containing protein [Methanobacteriaceae archaeon]